MVTVYSSNLYPLSELRGYLYIASGAEHNKWFRPKNGDSLFGGNWLFRPKERPIPQWITSALFHFCSDVSTPVNSNGEDKPLLNFMRLWELLTQRFMFRILHCLNILVRQWDGSNWTVSWSLSGCSEVTTKNRMDPSIHGTLVFGMGSTSWYLPSSGNYSIYMDSIYDWNWTAGNDSTMGTAKWWCSW